MHGRTLMIVLQALLAKVKANLRPGAQLVHQGIDINEVRMHIQAQKWAVDDIKTLTDKQRRALARSQVGIPPRVVQTWAPIR